MRRNNSWKSSEAIMKLPYSEGTVFLVPLRNGGFARGVVARVDPKGKILLGYFFGPRYETNAVPINEFRPDAALLRLRVGALGLQNGSWPILGQITGWKRPEWPMPDFVRSDPLGTRKPRLVHYADDDPSRIEDEHPIEQDPGLQTDSLSGYGVIEIKLTKLLAS
jgi:hypothetical protein